MFDFLSSDWFTIALEIVFLVFIVYDVKQYVRTKKNEYIVNIVLTIGFFIWTIIPFYNSYITWDDTAKVEVKHKLLQENNETLSECLSDSIYKEYPYSEYIQLDKNATPYKESLKEMQEECLDDSWF
jgi:hypothetical protein